MKNIKDITLLAFAVIGFYSIITAFTSDEKRSVDIKLQSRIQVVVKFSFIELTQKLV